MSTPLRQLLGDRLGEDVVAWVEIRRSRGASWRALARQLSAQTGIPVTHETVRGWCADDPEPVADSTPAA